LENENSHFRVEKKIRSVDEQSIKKILE